jgi:hypothetical protein
MGAPERLVEISKHFQSEIPEILAKLHVDPLRQRARVVRLGSHRRIEVLRRSLYPGKRIRRELGGAFLYGALRVGGAVAQRVELVHDVDLHLLEFRRSDFWLS